MSFGNDLVLGFDAAGNEVVLSKEKRGKHTILLGPTGVGKSKLIESLAFQDMRTWGKTGCCGVAVWDPHGVVVDNLVSAAAKHGFDHLPIIPFDSRRADYILSFNPMRDRKGIEPATIVSACIDSLLHAWGASDSNQTPRLEKWLRVILLTVFLSGGTLGDSLAILRSPDLRRAMVEKLEDDVARSVWASAASLKESQLSEVTESLMNRAVRFISAKMMRLTLNQVGSSLDFGSALEKGSIVLISLATAGGAIDDMDARTLGALLLQDLWLAARIRGKGEMGKKRAFRVYLDEFQKYLTPSMAEGLAEARGFGLQFVLACQSTTQMRATPAGQQVLDAVLANAHTKIIFGVQHPLDLDTLTPWLFRREVDTHQVKFQGFSTRVLGHELRYLPSISRATTHGTAVSTNWSSTESTGYTAGTSASRSLSRGTSISAQHGRSASDSSSFSSSEEIGTGASIAESAADGTTHSRSVGESRGASRSRSQSKHLDGSYDAIMRIVGEEPTTTFDDAYTDRDEERRDLHRTIDQSEAESESHNSSASIGNAITNSRSRARALQSSHSSSRGRSDGRSIAKSQSQTDAVSHNISEGGSYSESMSTSSSETTGGSETSSESETNGTTLAPMLVPKLGYGGAAPQFTPVEEQLFCFSQDMAALPDRHAFVRIGAAPPVEITTPTVKPATISAKGAKAWATLRLKRLPFAIPVEEAARRLETRQRQLEAKFLSPTGDEPTSLVRKIKR